MPDAQSRKSQLPGSVMDEIFSKNQSYTPVAYINSPRRNGRNTIVATVSDEKARESLLPETGKQGLLKPRPTMSFFLNKFNGPPNSKTKDSDILTIFSKRK